MQISKIYQGKPKLTVLDLLMLLIISLDDTRKVSLLVPIPHDDHDLPENGAPDIQKLLFLAAADG